MDLPPPAVVWLRDCRRAQNSSPAGAHSGQTMGVRHTLHSDRAGIGLSPARSIRWKVLLQLHSTVLTSAADQELVQFRLLGDWTREL
uniref:Uncharacterized protein n=1 Tax=Knipowitschia caucasica TaxID=637954 RepID=A0AAV2M561_KNICA